MVYYVIIRFFKKILNIMAGFSVIFKIQEKHCYAIENIS